MITINKDGTISSFLNDGGYIIRSQSLSSNKIGWDVYEVPLYGGDERLLESFENYELSKAIEYGESLT